MSFIYNIKLPNNSYSIIHNPIDTKLFTYNEKTLEQRYKILSIRTFASRKYANDLTIKCILELAKRNDFNKFSIKIIGNGKLFDEIVQPLRNYSNISIDKTFLTHTEIALLQKEYGIFLTPTRWDSQGVSRDESMSSGLVPVTNAVAAVPEFVDETCGILAPVDDAVAMAAGISRLVDDPSLFLSMSKAAAMRVRKESSASIIIEKELNLILGEL